MIEMMIKVCQVSRMIVFYFLHQESNESKSLQEHGGTALPSTTTSRVTVLCLDSLKLEVKTGPAVRRSD